MAKEFLEEIDFTPTKRLFYSIITDYDLNRSICELVDNAIDIWIKLGKTQVVNINVETNEDQQTIKIVDNAGGLKQSELQVILGPGHTSNLPEDETIGYFGVGTKRAVVALSQDIKITTRYKDQITCQVAFDESWLEIDEWSLRIYKVNDISRGSTIIELLKLRIKLTNENIELLKEHLEVTYAKFISNKLVNITLNGEKLQPINFENWAYPPGFQPRRYFGNLETKEDKSVNIEILAGLIKESSPVAGEYGVYMYCNDRLIARGLKSIDVGFIKGLAGKPHPNMSLTRIIVSLKGEAQLMPWNSSKSGIYSSHFVFESIQKFLIQVVKDFTSLSRRLEGNWHDKVFKYNSGKIIDVRIDNFPEVRKSYLPPLPPSKIRYSDFLKKKNKSLVSAKPWTKGLYESIIAVDFISRQNLEQRNRINLIILDSLLEIAFKEFLVNESKKVYNDSKLLKLFKNRHDVHTEIQKYTSFNSTIWGKINHYYNLRCKLIHERADVGITESQIDDYREIIESILKEIFKLKFKKK